MYPLVLGGVSIIASIVGTYFVKARQGGKIMNALYRGLIVAAVIAIVAFYPVTTLMLGDGVTIGGKLVTSMSLYLAALIGLALTAAMVVITEYYTATEYAPCGTSRRRPRPATAPTSSPASASPCGPRRPRSWRCVPRSGAPTSSRACTASRLPRPRCCR